VVYQEACGFCKMNIVMKPCPFCGKDVDLDNGDTIYPNGVGWIDKPYGRSYHPFREVPKEQWCYSMHCPTTSGGCGAEMSGDTKNEAIMKWNNRI
jgi:hypothetical protein